MAYNKKTWESDEVITQEALNNMEDGIAAAHTAIAATNTNLAGKQDALAPGSGITITDNTIAIDAAHASGTETPDQQKPATVGKVQELIGNGGTAGGGTAGVEIIDNLESTRTNAALSANQGRILDESKLNAQSSPNLFSPLPKSGNFEEGYGELRKKIEPGENGAVTVTDNSSTWFVSRYISVTPGKKYTTGCTGACNVVFVTSSQSTSSALSPNLNKTAIAIDGKKVNTISASQYIEAPEGAAYMLISALKGYGDSNALMNALRIYETDGLSNRFVPLTDKQTADTLSVSDASKLRSGLMVSEPVIGKNIVKCYNPRELISNYVVRYTKNKPFAISASDSDDNNANGKRITGRIPIIGGAAYYVQQNVRNVPLLIYFFNKNDEFVEKYQSGSANNDIVVAPVTAAWARIQYNSNTGLNCVVFTLGYYNAPGTEMDRVQGYAKQTTIADAISGDVNNSPSVSTIPTLSLNLDLIRELLTNDHQYDYWKGKKLFVDGDSISHYIDSMPFWQQHVANNLRMEFAIKQIPSTYYKANDFICIGDRGYGGTRLCPTIEKFNKTEIKKVETEDNVIVIGSNTSSDSTNPTNLPLQIERCLTWRVAEGFYADVEADLFILFIGSNDWGHPDDFNGGLGSISDAPFDPSGFSFGTYTLVSYNSVTFYGCLKYVVEWFIKNKPEADLVLLTPIKRDDDIHSSNNHRVNFQPNNDDLSLSTVDTPSHKLADYADAIKEVGKLYGVPVCDLFSNCFMNPGIGSPNAETESALENSQLKYYFDNYNVSGSSKKRDTTHPGPRGHEKIGRLVTGFLKSLC